LATKRSREKIYWDLNGSICNFLNSPRLGSSPATPRNLPLLTVSSPDLQLRTTEYKMTYLKAISHVFKRPERESNHSVPSVAHAKEAYIIAVP
jgi:hypothetical protein